MRIEEILESAFRKGKFCEILAHSVSNGMYAPLQGKSPPEQVKEPYGNLVMVTCRLSSCNPEYTEWWCMFHRFVIAIEELN